MFEFSGEWVLSGLTIHTTVMYERGDNSLMIEGQFGGTGASIQTLIKAFSGATAVLPIPSAISSVKLTKLSGSQVDDVTFLALSGSVNNANVFLIYRKSNSASSIAIAADTHRFKFSALVSSTTGIDISNIPFFGTLVVPQMGFTVASKYIRNPLLASLYPTNFPLLKLGQSISKGVTASFDVDIAGVRGIMAAFTKGELDLQVPKTVDFSLTMFLEQIPALKEVINSLPQTIQDIGSTRLHSITFNPATKDLALEGSLDSLTIIPDLLSLQEIKFKFAGTIGSNAEVKYVTFKGNWIINSLALGTEVIYENNLLLFEGYPAGSDSLDIRKFIKGLSGKELRIPSGMQAMKFERIIEKVQSGALNLVLMGSIGTTKVSIVYEKTAESNVVAFAADVEQLQLADLIREETGVDISDITFFGTLTIPSFSFVVSSKMFSTANLPSLDVPGVPKQLLADTIPSGVKGQFLADIGNVVGLKADLSDNILKIVVPDTVTFSVQNLLPIIPEVQAGIDSLPLSVQEILRAKITKLVFDVSTKELSLSLSLDTLTLVPNLISMKTLTFSLVTHMTETQLFIQRVQHMSSPNKFTYYQPLAISGADIQADSVPKFDFNGIWDINGEEFLTVVGYDKDLDQFEFIGAPLNSEEGGLESLIGAFSGADLSLPSPLASIQLTKVLITSMGTELLIVIIAKASKADVYARKRQVDLKQP